MKFCNRLFLANLVWERICMKHQIHSLFISHLVRCQFSLAAFGQAKLDDLSDDNHPNKQVMLTLPKFNSPWKMMVGRLLSFWDGIFSGAMLNFQGVMGILQHALWTFFVSFRLVKDFVQPVCDSDTSNMDLLVVSKPLESEAFRSKVLRSCEELMPY